MKTGYSWKAPASDVSIPCGLTRTLPPSGAPGLPMLENRTYVEVMVAFTPEGASKVTVDFALPGLPVTYLFLATSR